MRHRIANLTIQKWGNSLAVRIPAPLARDAHFHIGTPVELSVHDHSLIVKPTDENRMSLQERLDAFDPEKHGGEVMTSDRVGLEKF